MRVDDGAGNICRALAAGGSLVKLLGGLKGRAGVDWGKWHVFWVDERCVPHDDPESNYGGAVQAVLG